MEARGIADSEVEAVILAPDLNLPAKKTGRRLLERTIGDRRIAVVVKFNQYMTSVAIVTVWIRTGER